ncbi:MAG TPA: S53 family peptidase, partial [Pirellulales bacterium]|nr:S53 family peptidase [Pirellulales bacterium]
MKKLRLESLEPRAMLSATPNAADIVCHPNLNYFAGSGFNVYTPAQIRHAYGFDQTAWNGARQTIAIVDAYDDPTVLTDLQKFDRQFGLADPKLTVAKMTSGGRGPVANSGWSMEIALDVEWAHAIAPGANILLVEAVSASLNDLLTAVNYARNQAGVSVVSMSWGAGEFSGEGSFDSFFTTPSGHGGVTFVASSGDNGAPASWPSISTSVLSVGGTTLSLGAGGSYGGERGWGGSGGGYSSFIGEPTYQRSVQNTGRRSNPDVAYDADPYSGFYVRENNAWYAVGGTSAGAPQWAGLIALANQGRAAAGRAALSTALQAVYSLAAGDF